MISLAEKYHQRLSDPFAPLAVRLIHTCIRCPTLPYPSLIFILSCLPVVNGRGIPSVSCQLLPGGFPLQRVAKYASLAMEFAQARRRSLLVTHQLLRVREVDLRISEPPLR